jgi:methanethiol S-methyltransferase
LGLIWIAYCVLHSVLASSKVKNAFKKIGNHFFAYYRLKYNIISIATLAPILWFQYSFESFRLMESLYLKYFSLTLLVIPGSLIMIVSILKYFKMFSGIRGLYKSQGPLNLKVDGIHRYVRHPLYLGTLLFIWGLFFIFPLLTNLVSVTIITLYTLIGIKFEERKLLKEFGNIYAEYMKSVPGLIPRW